MVGPYDSDTEDFRSEGGADKVIFTLNMNCAGMKSQKRDKVPAGKDKLPQDIDWEQRKSNTTPLLITPPQTSDYPDTLICCIFNEPGRAADNDWGISILNCLRHKYGKSFSSAEIESLSIADEYNRWFFHSLVSDIISHYCFARCPASPQ